MDALCCFCMGFTPWCALSSCKRMQVTCIEVLSRLSAQEVCNPSGWLMLLQTLRSRRGKEENEIQRHQQEKEVSSNGRQSQYTSLLHCVHFRSVVNSFAAVNSRLLALVHHLKTASLRAALLSFCVLGSWKLLQRKHMKVNVMLQPSPSLNNASDPFSALLIFKLRSNESHSFDVLWKALMLTLTPKKMSLGNNVWAMVLQDSPNLVHGVCDITKKRQGLCLCSKPPHQLIHLM